MKTVAEYIFVISLLVTLLMGALSYASYRRHKDKEFSHLAEFWLALTVNTLAAWYFRNVMPQVEALSMVGWIWALRGFRLLLGDLSEHHLSHSWEYVVLAVGGFTSVALATYGQPFLIYTSAFTVAVVVVGFSRIFEAVKYAKSENLTSLHWAAYILTGLFFLSRLAFPILGLRREGSFSLLGDLILYIGFAGVLLSAYMEMMKKRHESEIEKVLKDRNDRLLGQSKYSELGMMSAGIAHEINNPLAVIQARATQLLRIYRDSKKQQEFSDGLQQILYTSERINRTIQGVREFVHQDEKGPVMEIELKDLVDDVLAFCGQRMKNHGINLRFYGLENYTIVGNKIQLEQVILNLLNNSFDAIEFLPDKWIEINVHQTGDKIQIYVKDSGPGIPPEIASRLMEPFFSTKDLGKGTGLGLALARGIAEKHGGALVYLSNTAHTTFMLELPKSPEVEWGIPLH